MTQWDHEDNAFDSIDTLYDVVDVLEEKAIQGELGLEVSIRYIAFTLFLYL